MGFWDSILSIGAGAIGAIAGGNQNNATQTSTTTPWKAQQPYLLGGFQDSANVYNALKQQPFYQGDFYAGLNNLQNRSIRGIRDFATGGGRDAAQNMLQSGQNSLRQGAMGQLGVAGDLAGFNTGAGTNFDSLTNFNPENATRQNISDAGQYANNPYLQGEIDAVSQDVRRNLTEDVLPGINRAASSSGLTNSSRAGVAEGIALRGAQDRIGNISSTMRSNAYQQGLGLAENARTANLGMQLSGLSQGLTNTENARQFNQNSRLNALANAGNLYGNAFGQGLQSTVSGAQQMYNNFDAMSQAGKLRQQDAQAGLNEDYAKWQGARYQGFNDLDRYMQLIGGQYGRTTTDSANNGMPNWLNMVQGGMGGATAGLGLYNSFRDIFNQNPTQS